MTMEAAVQEAAQDFHVPEFFADFTGVQVGPYGAILDFGLRQPVGKEGTPPAPQVRVRMSVEHLWVVSKIVDRTLRQFVEAAGPLPLPRQLLKEMELEGEYDRDMGDAK